MIPAGVVGNGGQQPAPLRSTAPEPWEVVPTPQEKPAKPEEPAKALKPAPNGDAAPLPKDGKGPDPFLPVPDDKATPLESAPMPPPDKQSRAAEGESPSVVVTLVHNSRQPFAQGPLPAAASDGRGDLEVLRALRLSISSPGRSAIGARASRVAFAAPVPPLPCE